MTLRFEAIWSSSEVSSTSSRAAPDWPLLGSSLTIKRGNWAVTISTDISSPPAPPGYYCLQNFDQPQRTCHCTSSSISIHQMSSIQFSENWLLLVRATSARAQSLARSWECFTSKAKLQIPFINSGRSRIVPSCRARPKSRRNRLPESGLAFEALRTALSPIFSR